jgi:hypothetical protein
MVSIDLGIATPIQGGSIALDPTDAAAAAASQVVYHVPPPSQVPDAPSGRHATRYGDSFWHGSDEWQHRRFKPARKVRSQAAPVRSADQANCSIFRPECAPTLPKAVHSEPQAWRT